MQELLASSFTSGRIIDVILVLVAVEALVLLAWRRGRGPSATGLLANLTSGAALMLALRAALTGAPWTGIAVCLLAALVAHGIDVAMRLRAADRSASDRPVRAHPASLGRRARDGRTGTAT